MEDKAPNDLGPISAELEKLRAELDGALQRIAVLDGKTDKPAAPEGVRERLQRERAERTSANELDRYANDNRRTDDARPLSKHRREELGARRSTTLVGAALPPVSGKSRPTASDEQEFYYWKKGKITKVIVACKSQPTEVK